jgi:hypothetical protein
MFFPQRHHVFAKLCSVDTRFWFFYWHILCLCLLDFNNTRYCLVFEFRLDFFDTDNTK